MAIETPRGLLVASLRATGRPVSADQSTGSSPLPRTPLGRPVEIRPRRRDAALADVLRVDAHLHRRLSPTASCVAGDRGAGPGHIRTRSGPAPKLIISCGRCLREFYVQNCGIFANRFTLGDRQPGGPRRVGGRAQPRRPEASVSRITAAFSRPPQPRDRSDRGRYRSRLAETATAPTSSGCETAMGKNAHALLAGTRHVRLWTSSAGIRGICQKHPDYATITSRAGGLDWCSRARRDR